MSTRGGTAVPDSACEAGYAFIDQELGESEAEAVRLHLTKCESCHARILAAWTIDSGARRLLGPVAVKKPGEEGVGFRWQLVPAGMLAGLVLVVAGGVGGRYYAAAAGV